MEKRIDVEFTFNSETIRIKESNIIVICGFGELDGRGIWTLTAENKNTTLVQYDWKVKMTKA